MWIAVLKGNLCEWEPPNCLELAFIVLQGLMMICTDNIPERDIGMADGDPNCASASDHHRRFNGMRRHEAEFFLQLAHDSLPRVLFGFDVAARG